MTKDKATKLDKDAEFTLPEVTEYLKTNSDFSFECQILALISAIDFKCEHGGTYTDPTTNKSRQFDIRAMKIKSLDGLTLGLYCAIECKNLKPSSPLLILTTPRASEESWHQLTGAMVDSIRVPTYSGDEDLYSKSPIDITSLVAAYRPRQPVGRDCRHLRRESNGSISDNDTALYDKWSQALFSSETLICRASRLAKQTHTPCLSLVLPIVVVPNGRLWQADFHADGTVANDPFQTEQCSYFIGRHYGVLDAKITHVEFVTQTRLSRLLTQIFEDDDLDLWFPEKTRDQFRTSKSSFITSARATE